jgi:phage baseplate assembly protein W
MDIYLDFGNDLTLKTDGDFKLVDKELLTYQRIVRRLLTEPGSYLWHPEYGAGFGTYIGMNLTPDVKDEIKGKIRSQMYLEESVSKTNAVQIEVNNDSVNFGNIICTIKYFDAETNQPYVLTFNVSN